MFFLLPNTKQTKTVSQKFEPPLRAATNCSVLVARSQNIAILIGSDLNIEFYNKATTLGLENPIPFEEALDILTVAELTKLSEEILIFLVNWSSIEAVKQYAQQLSETTKKGTKP